MEKDQLQRKVLTLALTAGRRFLLLGWIGGLILLFGLGIWFVKQIHLVASLVAVSILLAYVLLPFVNFFCQPIVLRIPKEIKFHDKLPCWQLREEAIEKVLTPRGLPRWLAISIVYLIAGLLIVVSLGYLYPVATEQARGLMANLTSMISNLQHTLDSSLAWLQTHAPDSLKPSLAKVDPDSIRLEKLAEGAQSSVPEMLSSTFSGVFSGVKFVGGLMATAILVPLFTFYILMDGDRYMNAFLKLVPRRSREEVRFLLDEIDHMLGRFIRGQLIVCTTIGFSIAVVLTLIGVDYAILIGIFAGVVDIIPYVGVAIGMVPAFIIALVQKGFLFAVFVLVAMEIVHWTEGHIIVPAVIGHSVGLPPLVVMIALGAGAELGGVMGMLLAIPTAAIIRVLGTHYATRLEAAELAEDSAAEKEAAAVPLEFELKEPEAEGEVLEAEIAEEAVVEEAEVAKDDPELVENVAASRRN